MRYSITNVTTGQVRAAGGKGVISPHNVPTVFAELTNAQVLQLKSQGANVAPVGTVKTGMVDPRPVVVPPTPVEAIPKYTTAQLAIAAGVDIVKDIFVPPLLGEGFKVAVIDTGIRETHNEIKGRIVYSENFTLDPMRDGFDHGTSVASVIVTLAPLCSILNMKVIGDNGEGTEESVVLAIDKCIDLHKVQTDTSPDIINLSLGAPDDGSTNNVMRVACRAAIEEGIWVFAAVGNGGPLPGTITSPATEKYVGAVGSISFEPFTISSFSSRGPTKEGLIKPDGVAFGEDIVLASSSGDTATTAKSGTSFAVAFISGLTIIYFEGAYKNAEIKYDLLPGYPREFFHITQEEFIDTWIPIICAKPAGSPAGKDNDYGYGIPYGPLASRAIGLVPAIGVDLSMMVSGMMAIGMIGMMAKIIK